MKNIIIRLVFTLLFGCCASALVAQPADPPSDPTAVPIDGGLSILIAAGAALGGKKVWDARKDTNVKS